MLSAFCGPGYHCKANPLQCTQVYMDRCVELGQNAVGFRDSDGGFCCNSTWEVAGRATEPYDDNCGPYVTIKPPPEAQCGEDCNSLGDPINPANGGVFAEEKDIAGPVPFERYFNSASSATSRMSAGWTHSYSRKVTRLRNAGRYRPYAAGGGNSSSYSNESDACTAGFAEIRSQVPEWVTATATFSGGSCNVSSGGGGTIGTVSMLYSVPPLEEPTATTVGFSVSRDDGRVIRFPVDGSTPQGIKLMLSLTVGGFTIIDENDNVESYNSDGQLTAITSRAGVVLTMGYDAFGKLTSVTDSYGHAITLGYDAKSRVATATGSASQIFQYGYDVADRFASVTAPDSTTKTYLYENVAFPNALTAVKDENNSVLSTWTYDAEGRATHTEENGGASAVTLVYNTDVSVTVTDALGAVRTFTYERHGDLNLVGSITGSQCPTCREGAATTYDTAGFVSSRRDYNGNLICYENDARGLVLVRVEGYAPGISACPVSLSTYTPAPGTRQRKITTAWHTTLHLPISITELNRTTTFTHDATGNVITRIVTDTSVTPHVSRTSTYTYDAFGRVLTENGPRTDSTDLTTYTYYTCSSGYQCGQLNSVTDAAGHLTTYNLYNTHGRPTQITDPNGLVISLAYDLRQRITDRCIGSILPGCSGGELTRLDYWSTGLLKKVTNPDGSYIEYTYDSAHRLTQINDGALNKIVYTLDNMGNRTAENTYDPSNMLKRTHTQVFNTLNQLLKDVNAAGTANVTTVFGYDNNGNQISVNAPLARNSSSLYDELNRLKQITDSNSGITQFGYDANDNLTSVADPLGLVTTYLPNGFGEDVTINSPDTGLTTNTYDSAGNLKTSLDSRGALSTNTYDALNRLTLAQYTGGSYPAIPVSRSYIYDSCLNGKGQLCQMTDPAGTTSWTYDTRGRAATKAQTFTYAFSPYTKTYQVHYGYNAAGQLDSMTYPSGMVVNYSYSNGRISSITATVGGALQAVLSNATYEPFGSIKGWTWGNGSAASRTSDTDGRISGINSPGMSLAYQYDDASRVTAITDQLDSSNSWSYSYDGLDRLTNQSKSGWSASYQYDANGNRTTESGSFYATPHTYVYDSPRTSNRLSKVMGVLTGSGGAYSTQLSEYYYDARGNSSLGPYVYPYFDAANRLYARGGARIFINGLGQRIRREYAGERHWTYDEAGHVLGQYDYLMQYLPASYNTTPMETIWLGDLPVAVVYQQFAGEFDPNDGWYVVGLTPPKLLYVQADQLGTPKLLTKPSDNTVAWRWDPDAFGAGWVGGELEFSQRFPGQIQDPDSNTFYNYFRDYDPANGRYGESDPIGLHGGVNTYAYALGRPTSLFDSRGLDVDVIINNNAGITGTHAGLYINTQGRILYDPGGSYRNDIKGSMNVLDGADANLSDYIKFQQTDGSNVEIFQFPLTSEQDRQILKNIEDHERCDPGDCSKCVSDVLRGVGPFKNLGEYRFPSNLANKLRQLQQSGGGQNPADLSSPYLAPSGY